MLIWKWIHTLVGSSGSIKLGGSFGSSEATDFCFGNTPTPTCTDDIQNGDETGIDCGGSSCTPCSTAGTTTLHQGFFEYGWDGWSDGVVTITDTQDLDRIKTTILLD